LGNEWRTALQLLVVIGPIFSPRDSISRALGNGEYYWKDYLIHREQDARKRFIWTIRQRDKKHSSENPTEVFVSDDGRFVFNGQIFKSKEELKRTIDLQSKLAKKALNSRFWRFFLGIKKQK